MIDAAEAAIRFVRDRDRGDLDTDQMLLFALVRATEELPVLLAQLQAAYRE